MRYNSSAIPPNLDCPWRLLMAQKLATEQLTITDWVKGLAAIPERDFTLENVQDYILRHAVRPDTLEKYCFYSKGNYTRNLIFKNEVFECMTICWEVGQASRIHNHRGQNCWMSAPIGRLKVQNFRVDDRDAAHGTCRIIPTEIYEMDAAHPAYVNPLEPVHQVLNLPEFNQRSVSIHVYSKPFDTCEVYLREKGTYGDVPLHYTSQYGKLDPAEKLL
jgi:cysteine dioxygenase